MQAGIIPRAVSCLLVVAGVAAAETLEEASRRERARRESYGSPAPVIGMEDLERATPGQGTFSMPGGTSARAGSEDAAERTASQAAVRRGIGAEYDRVASRAQRILEDASVHAGTCGGTDRPARCRGEAVKLAARAAALARVLEAADDRGREARLLPGEMRVLARQHGLEDVESALRRIVDEGSREAARPDPGADASRPPTRGGASGAASRRPSSRRRGR